MNRFFDRVLPIVMAGYLCGIAAAQSAPRPVAPPKPTVDDNQVIAQIRATLPPVPTAATSKQGAPSIPGKCPCCGQPMPAGAKPGAGSASAPTKPSTGGEIVVVSMRGPFSEYGLDGTTISPFATQLTLDLAAERKPLAIVLDVDSPGGLVWVMQNVIAQLLKRQAEDNLRVVAWPDKAHSAAAMTCLACKELVVRPTTRLGAATKVLGNDEAPKPKTAMDQKIASDEGAFLRQIVQLTGRDIRVFQAMQQPKSQLWYREGFGFADQAPSSTAGWIKLDDNPDQPATMNADELVETHLARGKASNDRELLSTLGLPADTAICRIDLAEPKIAKVMKPVYDAFRKWYEWRAKAYADFERTLTTRTTKMHDAILDIEALQGGNGWSDAQQQRLNVAISNCKNIEKMPDELAKALEGEAILDCWRSAYQIALDEVELAKTAAKPRSAGGRSKTVDLDGAHQHLVRAHNSLMDVINGCPDKK